ncbi:MAG TPA: peptidoglycan editing factor PgeF [candidate division Zixibacteria bacterium]|nr:peptidoglycan editing factor PgeF [candidate division Zixibacteria bacterium]
MKAIIEPPNIICKSGLKAFFTTKKLTDDNTRIYGALSKEFDVPEDRIYLPVQKHTDKIQVLEQEFEPSVADAVITSEKNILIGILVADCVPLLIFDKEKEVIGAVHAGWKGTAKQVLKNTIKAMLTRYRSCPEDISLAVGPSIRQCCYEVGADVMAAVREATGEGDYYHREGNRHFLDLASVNKIQALDAGILQENIWLSGECTFCNPDKFYSYRYSKKSIGRQGGFIVMW